VKTRIISLDDAFWFQEGPGVRKWQFTTSGIKLLNVGNILPTGDLDLSTTDRFLSLQEVNKRYKHFLLDPGDLVIASSGISFDDDGLLRTRGAFVRRSHLPLCLNTSTIRFKPKGEADLRYLRFWLDSYEFRSQITRRVTGSAQQNFGPSHLEDILISLPELSEQQQIGEQLERADRLRRTHRHARQLSGAFLPAAFIELFGNDFEKASSRPLGELVTITGGGTPSRDHPEYFRGNIPWLTSKDMRGDYIWDTEEHITEDAIHNSATKLVPLNSILVVVKSKILMHRLPVAIAKVGICHGQDIKSIQCSKELHPEFARFTLKFYESRLLHNARGANTEGLTLPMLEELRVPQVPFKIQSRFASMVEKVERVRAVHEESLRQADHLFRTLLHRLFGESSTK